MRPEIQNVCQLRLLARFAIAATVVWLLATPCQSVAQRRSTKAKATGKSAVTNASSKKAVDWRAKRVVLTRQYGADLQGLALWCRDKGIEEQVSQTYRVYREFGLDRQYIFLPTEKSMPSFAGKDLRGQWLEKLNQIKVDHAAELFKLAEEAANSGSYAVAFQLLHEVIYYDRDHQEVRRILGHKKLKDGKWRIEPERVKSRISKSGHELVNWKAGSFITVNTPHFQIDSNASEKETIALAQKLETWHYVWRQVFFEYWAKASVIKKWISGSGGLKMPRRRFRVVFFKDHADYVRNLAPIQRGIENTAGYYNGTLNVSFFPATNADGQRDEATWRHEMTHQLFRESIASRKQPFAEHFLWVDEGVAMHFESLKVDGQIATLGGFDAQRLQFARIRRLRENYHVPFATLAGLNMQQFQSRTDLGYLYAQCAGLAHMLMDGRKYDMQPVLVDFLKTAHKRKIAPESFEKFFGRSFAQLDNDYVEFLRVSNQDVEKRIENASSISELAAPDADLSDEAYDVLGTCINLRWLDITGTKLSKQRAIKLQDLDLIRELFLCASSIEPGALKLLGQMESLRELDLSSSSVADAQLPELRSLPSLEVLWISNTRVTDAGLLALAKIPNLKVLQLKGAKVTPAGISRFRQLRNDVTVKQ